MEKGLVAKIACVVSLAMVCVLGMVACGDSVSGGVAATVNGKKISEDEITKYIETYRSSIGCTDEAKWGEWLSSSGYTPDSVRSDVIDLFVNEEVVKQAASENNVKVESSTIDQYVSSIKSYYSTDAEWKQALQSAGYTEQAYRENIELSLMKQSLMDVVTPKTDPSEEDMVEYCSIYAPSFDGARRSSHILFDQNDKKTAQSVLDQINAGTLDFAAAASQYSIDEGSKGAGGDVGWDKLNSFVDEYASALSGLSKGQVSGLVESDFGIHIIKCTDLFTAPAKVTSTSQLPQEFIDQVKGTLSSSNQATEFTSWLENYQASLEIVKNDIPQNVPYNIDMSKYLPEIDASSGVSVETSAE